VLKLAQNTFGFCDITNPFGYKSPFECKFGSDGSEYGYNMALITYNYFVPCSVIIEV